MLSATNGQPTTEVENGESAGLVRRSVDDLPEHLRSAIVLCYYQGLKYKDIADSLGIPVGTVKSRLHAAIVRLSETWKRWGLSEESC
jgi:RNA polymerase sigma-70 factor (ECF subfamily)